MKVEVEGKGSVEVPEDSSVSTLVKELDYHLDSVVVLLDDEPLSLDHGLKEGMELKIVSVVSGG
ncbi:MAG: MoaD/ThiS family protein [Candidatus Aenigmatarchaeota archaeon]